MPGAQGRAPKRTVLWYLKAVFAACACGLVSIVVLFVLSMIVLGSDVAVRWIFEPIGGVRPFGFVMLLLAVVWAPFVWKRLR
jgi:hypothetical protein